MREPKDHVPALEATAVQRALPWVGGAMLAAVPLASMFWLSVPAVLLLGIPTWIAESVWYWLPGGSRGVYAVLTALPYLLVPVAVAWLFMALCRRIARRPERARVALVVSAVLVAALSAAWHVTGWGDGMRYQGRGFILGNLVASGVAVAAMGMIAALWRWRSTPALPMLFLWLELAWVLGFAFPWMGETW